MCRVRPAQPPFFCLENDGPIRFIERTPRQERLDREMAPVRISIPGTGRKSKKKAEATGFRFFVDFAGSSDHCAVTTMQHSSVVASGLNSGTGIPS